ncbi:MAG TPA: hypothetical protein VJ249_06815 [Candidatus Bathyarchaeia archaeon]|nr:hypothetical protein [Candidatus Bathyarchaeia archaeon]
MKPNPILKELNAVEERFLKWYKQFDPSSAYTDGINLCAGKFFVPSKKNLAAAENELKSVLKLATNEDQRGLLRSYLTSLSFNEPYMVPSRAANAFFAHLVKEGIVPEHLQSLAMQVGEALKAYTSLLGDKKWSTEIRILTCQTTDHLLGILDTIFTEAKDENVKKSMTVLKQEASKYRRLFGAKGIKQGDFGEVYPIIRKNREKVQHKAKYPKLLADVWGYPETTEEIEAKATRWLKKELPILHRITRSLAKAYGAKPSVETMDEEISKRKGIPRQEALQFVRQTRYVTQKVFDDNIVRMTPKYETRVIETPPYLVNLITTAAMMPFDGLTHKPFNVFFITTDPRTSSSINAPELVQAILHEEYGHAVNYSNSVTQFAANPRLLEIVSSAISTHISDGISFHRELEFAILLKKLSVKKKPSDEETALLKILSRGDDIETMLLENEFIVQKWRIMRFLRAIFDVRINMEKEPIADFVEWAHKETGLSKKMIYNETWGFLETVGYAPCYCIAGDVVRRLQTAALRKGKSLVDFNTYVSSLGFPPRKTFERKIRNFINKPWCPAMNQ